MNKVLIDTCVWSEVFRRSSPNESVRVVVQDLLKSMRVVFIGPIRQEILSGIKDKAQFDKLRLALGAFSDEAIETGDYELAAEYSNKCRARGIQGSAVDYLICAFSGRRGYSILTVDKDFENFQKLLPITLEQIKF